MLATYLNGMLAGISPDAEAIARAMTARVPEGIDLLILRSPGDEASLSLGMAQLLSWATTKAYVFVAKYRARMRGAIFRKKAPRPRFWLFWGLGLALTALCVYGGPTLFLVALFVLVISLVLRITTFFDETVHGLVLLGLGVANAIGAVCLGMVPSGVEELTTVSRLRRFFVGIAFSLVVEVNTEAAPPGTWKVIYLESDVIREMLTGGLIHSIYTDPRATTKIIEWLTAYQVAALDRPVP